MLLATTIYYTHTKPFLKRQAHRQPALVCGVQEIIEKSMILTDDMVFVLCHVFCIAYYIAYRVYIYIYIYILNYSFISIYMYIYIYSYYLYWATSCKQPRKAWSPPKVPHPCLGIEAPLDEGHPSVSSSLLPILCHTMPYHTIAYDTRLCDTRLRLYYTILYYTMLYYTILYYTILYYTILYYTILYYTILYYTILYYTILYFTMPQVVPGCLKYVN